MKLDKTINVGQYLAIANIDYELLAKQRNLLVVTIWQDKESELWGLVNMLDELIDANDAAEAVLWDNITKL
jgi:hypothetical protein